MTLDLIPEDELRAALRPYRAEPDAFEARVRERLAAAHAQRADEPLAKLSPWLKAAAAFLPLEVLAGCKGTAAAAKLAPTGGAYKLVSYAAFPAISLFVLLGAAVFSVAKIRGIQDQTEAGLSDQAAVQMANQEWWRRHKWGAWAVFAATMALMMVGATWILFLFYLISMGLLLFVLGSFAKLGLGNRQLIARSCGMGLMFLGQAASMSGIGYQEIHFIDQKVVAAIFFAGTMMLLPLGIGTVPVSGWPATTKTPRWFWFFVAVFGLVQLLIIVSVCSIRGLSPLIRAVLVASLVVAAAAPVASMAFRASMAGQRIGRGYQWGAMGFMAVLLVPLMAWMLNPILWPATPAGIKRHVESFTVAPHSSASWQNWEIVADWAIQSKLDPDLSNPRRLLAEQISGEQNRYILSSAFRVGLLPADQLGELREYEGLRRGLLATPPRDGQPQVITSLEQHDWVIRAAVMRNELSSEERDLLEQRLYATLDNMITDKYIVLETALRVTQLLEIIGRPIDRDLYRGKVHEWLRMFHSTGEGWGHIAGGFKKYLRVQAGSLDGTSHAVELMEIYGIPDDLNLTWVRSYLRPGAHILHNKWIAAATLERLNQLPGATQPTWLEVLYYERSMLAAAVLVGLCLYATLSSPILKTSDPADKSPPVAEV